MSHIFSANQIQCCNNPLSAWFTMAEHLTRNREFMGVNQ